MPPASAVGLAASSWYRSGSSAETSPMLWGDIGTRTAHLPDMDACTCDKYRPVGDDGKPHWADLNNYCPAHGTRTAVPHDLTQFPDAQNDHSCTACRHGDHIRCIGHVHYPDWDHPCACGVKSPNAHARAREAGARSKARWAVEAGLAEHDENVSNAAIDAIIRRLAPMLR